MHALLFSYLYRFPMYTWRFSIVLVIILVQTSTVVAQVETSRSDEIVTAEKNYTWRIGISFSGYSVLNEISCDLDDEFCYDNMPYPYIHTRVSYKNWQIISSWSNDQNEFIFNLSGRYNYYPLKKYKLRPFGFAGIGTWYFNRKWIYREHASNSPEYNDCQYDYYCSFIDNIILYEEFTDPEFTYKLDKDRPDGKSIFSGLTGGIGIEYNMGNLVFTHEFDLYWTYCSYTEFICTVPDFKFLGIHFQF